MTTEQQLVVPDFPTTYRLRRALDFAGFDPETAAETLGLHINTMRNYLRGRTVPRRVALIAIAQLTNVPLWWLEGHDHDPAGGDGGGDTRRYVHDPWSATVAA